MITTLPAWDKEKNIHNQSKVKKMKSNLQISSG
jgi:hypothetical protein